MLQLNYQEETRSSNSGHPNDVSGNNHFNWLRYKVSLINGNVGGILRKVRLGWSRTTAQKIRLSEVQREHPQWREIKHIHKP